MTPVFMACHHDPSIGAYGDCMRACIASLLNLPSEEVPHFFDYPVEQDSQLGYERLDAFLERRGLVYLQFPIGPGELEAFLSDAGHHVICGVDTVTQTTHALIGRAGVPVHNPDPRGLLAMNPLESEGSRYLMVGFVCVR